MIEPLAPHVAYARALLFSTHSSAASSADPIRVTMVYFALLTLDVCGALPAALPAPAAASVAAWVLRCLPPASEGVTGFCGSPPSPGCGRAWSVAATFSALACLATLGAPPPPLPPLPVARLRAALAAAQERGGGPLHGAVHDSPCAAGMADARFVFAAAAACALLGGAPSATLDAPAAARFLVRCQTHEGGFALRPGGEAHGGSTYCAVAALALLGWRGRRGLAEAGVDAGALRRWLALRAGAAPEGGGGGGCGDGDGGAGAPLGFSGRAGKGPDACYTFWCGAAGAVAGAAAPWPARRLGALSAWLADCRGPRGAGFGKDPEAEPDPLHTAYALAGLAAVGGGAGALGAVAAEVGVTARAWGAVFGAGAEST
jgi:geranylgeranyl transferase type-1 subunit beta